MFLLLFQLRQPCSGAKRIQRLELKHGLVVVQVYFVKDRKLFLDEEDRQLFYPIVSAECRPYASLTKPFPGGV